MLSGLSCWGVDGPKKNCTWSMIGMDKTSMIGMDSSNEEEEGDFSKKVTSVDVICFFQTWRIHVCLFCNFKSPIKTHFMDQVDNLSFLGVRSWTK